MSNHIFRKSHYIWLSSWLRDEKHLAQEGQNLTTFYQMVSRLTKDLYDENPNFDPEKFLINSECENLLTKELEDI